MKSAWKTLMDAGLPDGAIRVPPSRLDPELVRSAVAEIARTPDAIDPARREPLLAWLRAWRAHWPESFRETLSPDGERLIAALECDVDDDRYLKLRRIAIENLSGVL